MASKYTDEFAKFLDAATRGLQTEATARPKNDTYPTITFTCPKCRVDTRIPLATKPLLHHQYECWKCDAMLRVEQVNDNYVVRFVSVNPTGCTNGNCEE